MRDTNTKQPALARLCKVSQPTISGWLTKTNPIDSNARLLARVIGQPENFWRDDYVPEVAPTLEQGIDLRRFGKIAKRIGLADDVALILQGGNEAGMRAIESFPEEVRRAILGVVHVLGYPLESAQQAAREALAEYEGGNIPPEAWFSMIRAHLPKRPPSGTHPSSGSMKVAPEK